MKPNVEPIRSARKSRHADTHKQVRLRESGAKHKAYLKLVKRMKKAGAW